MSPGDEPRATKTHDSDPRLDQNARQRPSLRPKRMTAAAIGGAFLRYGEYLTETHESGEIGRR